MRLNNVAAESRPPVCGSPSALSSHIVATGINLLCSLLFRGAAKVPAPPRKAEEPAAGGAFGGNLGHLAADERRSPVFKRLSEAEE